MNEALDILGYKVSDIARNNDELINVWWKFHEGKGTPADIKMMFEGYDATGDAPCFIYWKDFLKAYPDIKVSLHIFCHGLHQRRQTSAYKGLASGPRSAEARSVVLKFFQGSANYSLLCENDNCVG